MPGNLHHFGNTDPMKSQRLAAYGVCIEGEAILLVRASTMTEVPGRWFLPGGGVDHGEHPEESLIRELREETGLSGKIGAFLGVLSDVRTRADDVRHHTIRLIYQITELSGELRSEASGSSDLAQWIPLRETKNFPIAQYAQRSCQLLGITLLQ